MWVCLGVPPHVLTRMHRNGKWPPPWRHPCLSCLTYMYVHTCVHACEHVKKLGLATESSNSFFLHINSNNFMFLCTYINFSTYFGRASPATVK